MLASCAAARVSFAWEVRGVGPMSGDGIGRYDGAAVVVFDAVDDFGDDAVAGGAFGIDGDDGEGGHFWGSGAAGSAEAAMVFSWLFALPALLLLLECEVLLEGAVFAVKGAVGGGFVAEVEVVHFDFFGSPVEGGAAVDVHAGIGIVVALAADAVPVGFGGAADEVVSEGMVSAGAATGVVDEGLFFFGDAMFAAPAGEEDLEGGFGFAGEDEGFGAAAVGDGVTGRAETTCQTRGPGAAGVTFFLEGRDGFGRVRNFLFVVVKVGGGILAVRGGVAAGSNLVVHSEMIVKSAACGVSE